MELPAWASVFAVALATVLFLCAVSARRRRRPLSSLPGPKPWPVIGNFNLLGTLPHRSLDALSKRHGPLMRVQFGSFPVVIASSVDTAKFFLKTHDSLFIDRPKMAAGKYTTYDYSNIAWSPYGAYWRQARKICADELFSARRLESSEHVRREELRALLRELHAAAAAAAGAGQVVPLKELLSTMSLNMIARMVLGRKAVDGGEVVASGGGGSATAWKEFRWMLDELFLLNGVLNVGDWIPWMACMDLQGYVRRMKRVGKMFDRFMENVVEEHEQRRRREGDAFVARDMVDRLLQLADDPSLEVKLTRNSVKAFTQYGTGPRRRGHRERRGDRGVGDLRTPKEPRGLRQGHRGAGRRDRPGPVGHGEGHGPAPLRGRHREGDDAPAHGRPAAVAAPVAGGHVGVRPRHPRGHARARERVDHQPRPRAVGGARGVPAAALRREQDRRQGAGLRDAAVRVRPADVPRVQPRPEGDPGDPRKPAARV
ncbi:unnamed protein product [Urochloa decumbens]|uniref:Uncharacterized protein n=1 Tax=Urochloa decumbens TaxID=240449 RepID=A0ABC9EXE2_9POAL